MGKLKKVNFDGTGLTDVLTGLAHPQGLGFDESLDRIFWVDSDDKTINSANTDGTNPQAIVNSANTPLRLALDKVNQKIYWVERSSDMIRRSDYDGTNVETVANILVSTGIAIDNLNNKIYWNENASSSLKRMDFDGSNVETVFGNYGLSGVALDINYALPIEPDVDAYLDMKVYPNPSSRMTKIEIDNPGKHDMKVLVSDQLGRTIWESENIVDKPTWAHQLEIFNSGIYFITAWVGNKALSETLIVLEHN